MTANMWIKTLHFSENVFWYICETFKNNDVGFPGGSMVKNTPANAGDMGLIPGQIPHVMEQLSPCVMTIKYVL